MLKVTRDLSISVTEQRSASPLSTGHFSKIEEFKNRDARGRQWSLKRRNEVTEKTH
jgi:hypothetical protein